MSLQKHFYAEKNHFWISLGGRNERTVDICYNSGL